ncbi:MAG TPA: helix-turn-helix domain-containing protein [Myxococcota bacterium]|nr:helix-turn-helix domain-containing protein [Myxococcota bacterium]
MSLDIDIPSETAVQEAEVAVRALEHFVGGSLPLRLSVGDTAVPVALPTEAIALLVRILAHMANGDAVALVPIQAEVTTQQAADLLHVSRPYLIKLLEEGKLPYRRIGSHRRIPLRNLLAYKRQDDAERRAIADELTAEAQLLGLDY